MSTTSDEQEKLDSHIHEQRHGDLTVPTSFHNTIRGDFSMIQPQLEPFSSCFNTQPLPHHQQALVPTPSVNQFSYQQTLLVSGMNDLPLSQTTIGVPFPSQKSLPLSGYHPSQEGTFPINYELMNELELKLGVKTTFNCNWTLLAEKLGFNEGEILYLEGAEKPTIKVLREAFIRGYFKTLDDLIPILNDMKRIDVVRILSKHLQKTQASNVD